MRHHLSRRQSLSLGVFGALGVFAAWSCGGDESSPTGGTGGTGGSGTGGGDTGGSAGSGGATGGTGGATGGTGGATGGTGGATGGTGGAGGTTGGAGGTTGGASGSGGSTGGASGSGGAGGGQDAGTAKDSGSNTGCGMAVVALVSQNHTTGPHVLTIPPEDVTAGADKIYNARGQSSHDHFVQLTAADFATLKAGGTVIKKSCNSTDHEFVLSCAPPSRTPTAPTCTDECGLTMTTLCPS